MTEELRRTGDSTMTEGADELPLDFRIGAGGGRIIIPASPEWWDECEPPILPSPWSDNNDE